MKIRFKMKILLGILLVVLVSWEAPADDGYELWLKYRRVNDEHLLKQYRKAITRVVLPGESKTLRVIRSELKKGLDVMLGVDMRFRAAALGNALVIGTPGRSDIVRQLQRQDRLQNLGSEGYLMIEVMKRFDLFGSVKPFQRCIKCNTLLTPISKTVILDRLPPRVSSSFQDFQHCPNCDRVYWKGTHYERMRAFIERVMRFAFLSSSLYLFPGL